MALYTAASLLHALAERVNSEEQREQRKHPAGDGEEIVILHGITLFRMGESGQRSRASPLDYGNIIAQPRRKDKRRG